MDDIIKTLAGQLGLSTEQAAGGAGAVINLIKDGIDAEDFKKLASMVPEVSGWMKAAPKAGAAAGAAAAGAGGGLLEQAGDLLGALTGGGGGGAGGVLGSLGDLSVLMSALGKLGIDPETAAKFVPTLLQFLHSKAGADLMGKILANIPALKNLGGGGGGDLAGMLGGLFR